MSSVVEFFVHPFPCGSSSSSSAPSDPGAASQAFLRVAHGSGAQPSIAEVKIGSTQGASAAITRLGGPGVRSAAEQKAKTTAAAVAPTVLGPLEANAARQQGVAKREATDDA